MKTLAPTTINNGMTAVKNHSMALKDGDNTRIEIEILNSDAVSDFIPPLTAYEYRGYIISAWARPEFSNGSTSVGVVYKRDKFGTMRVHRIEGKLFESEEQAEQHGLELCREWIDKQKLIR